MKEIYWGVNLLPPLPQDPKSACQAHEYIKNAK